MSFGQGRLDVRLEADLILPQEPQPLAGETAAVRRALERPIGTRPLAEIVRPGERVAIVVNDITRLAHTDLLLPPIVETLNRAGVQDADILVVFALGLHRRQTDTERKKIVGEEMFRRLRAIDHIADDDASLVAVGTTSFGNLVEINREVWEADRIILTGEIIHHMIAGYSGGRKSLVPGVAGRRTITFNHRMILEPGCRAGVLEGNPAHEDMLEACRLIDPDFILNVVLTTSGRPASVVAGHYDLAHREGSKAADRLLLTEVDEPYDLIVASAGGHPMDIDLRQTHKAMEKACEVLRPGGTLLFYGECSNGAGHRLCEEYLWRYDTAAAMEEALRREFAVGAHKAWWVVRMGEHYDVHLVSGLDPRFVERCHFKHVPPARHAERLRELLVPSARVGVIPNAAFTRPVIR